MHVPTTYSGAEWTTHYGIRSPDRVIQGGGGGARPVGIVYDVELTLDLPPDVTAGTAMNALAHCAEALYVKGRNAEGDEQALAGAPLIASALPRVLADPHDRAAREELLRGAAHAGHALGLAGLALAHAMAQALGGRYGLPHGAMNAICLSPALRFNARVRAGRGERFGGRSAADAVARTRSSRGSAASTALRDHRRPRGGPARARRGGRAARRQPGEPAARLGRGDAGVLRRSIW